MSIKPKYFIVFVLLLIITWTLVSVLRIYIFSKRAGVIIQDTRRFERQEKGKTMLVIGDSVAYGTGASSPDKSIAGLIANKYGYSNVTNIAENGKRTSELVNEVSQINEHYDLIFIVIGGNDIIRPWIRLDKSASNLESIYYEASSKADNVIAITTGNIKYTTLFLPPLTHYLGYRSTKLRDSALETSKSIDNLHYIDIITFNENNEFTPDMEAADHLHLSDKGNAYWLKAVEETVQANGLSL